MVLFMAAWWASSVSAAPITITSFEHITSGTNEAIIAVDEYAPGYNLGAAFTCRDGQAGITLQFGGFPGRARPVQAAVRLDGQVFTFSAKVAGGRQAGFHSPVITAPEKIAQFLGFVFRPGALVTNGYRGFVLQAGPGEDQVTTFMARCG